MSEVPTGWAERALGDFCVEVSRRGGDVPVLSVSKDLGVVLQTEKFKKRVASDDTSRYKRIFHGEFVYDPMLLWTGSICRQLRVPEGCVSPAYCTFTVNDSVDHGFLEFFLRRPGMLHHYRGISRGTNVRRQKAPFASFGELRFLFPPLGEQRKIAAILTAVDKAIAQTQAVIDQLQVVKKGLMQELLTKGIPGRHTRFKQTDLGKIPADWRVVPLGEILADGPTNGIYKPSEQIGAGALLMGMTAIIGTSLDWSKSRRATVNAAEIARHGLRARDLLITRVYARIEGVGRFILVSQPPEDAVYESNMMRVRIDERFATPEFVGLQMCSAAIRTRIEQQATLGAQASINGGLVRSLPVALPAKDEQARIVELVKLGESRRSGELAMLQQLAELKQALASRLLTGKLRVRPDPAPEPAP